jgi:hypothetical protein
MAQPLRDAGNIVHIDDETGEARKKHLHDVRGTFATRLIRARLADQEIAEVTAWSTDRIANIRRVYIDQSSLVVAIGARFAKSAVKQNVN